MTRIGQVPLMTSYSQTCSVYVHVNVPSQDSQMQFVFLQYLCLLGTSETFEEDLAISAAGNPLAGFSVVVQRLHTPVEPAKQ